MRTIQKTHLSQFSPPKNKKPNKWHSNNKIESNALQHFLLNIPKLQRQCVPPLTATTSIQTKTSEKIHPQKEEKIAEKEKKTQKAKASQETKKAK